MTESKRIKLPPLTWSRKRRNFERAESEGLRRMAAESEQQDRDDFTLYFHGNLISLEPHSARGYRWAIEHWGTGWRCNPLRVEMKATEAARVISAMEAYGMRYRRKYG